MTTRTIASEPRRPHFPVGQGQIGAGSTAIHGVVGDTATRLPRCQRIAVMTQGLSTPEHAKTAIQLLRYREADIAAVLDSDHSGSTAQRLFGVGGATPVVARLGDAGPIDSVFLGIAPPGGRLPAGWSQALEQALRSGLTVVSGMHDRLADDPALAAAAHAGGGRVIDVRSSDWQRTASAKPVQPGCFRILTVGTDCGVGKMSAAKELELELRARGRSAKFLATGQTGVMIGGSGVVIDAVISDFVNGTVEQLVREHEEHDYLLIEGQGSIVHPAYSGVAVGLLHGATPDALVLCHELGRERLKSLQHVPVHPLKKLIRLHEAIGGARHPCKVIGLALNGRRFEQDEAAEQIDRISLEIGLPACDVYRDGVDCLIDAIEQDDRAVRDRCGVVAGD